MAKKKPTKAKTSRPRPGPERAAGLLPAGYAEFLDGLKARIRTAQVRAALAVNRELVTLYWEIGKAVVERQQAEGWGRSVIGRLATDLQAAFPGVGGFSPSNVWRMRGFYLAYTAAVTKLAQPVRELDGATLPPDVADIPWGHNILLVEKLDDPIVRLWYARMATEQGWSRSVLQMQIEAGAHRRQGKALTNFAATLPAPQSDLARDLLKDPYNFEFLTLADDAQERHLQAGLLEHLREFLLELGVGFAFVGSRHHIEVGGKDYYLDLLFYHLKLRAFVVIELKVTEFEPEHLGKMNFYLSAVDSQLRHADDKPSIGLLLCPVKNSVVVEYALRDTSKPIGVAGYTAGKALPADLRDQLPSPERLEEELRKRGPRPAKADETKRPT
jgi:predicted nuclease of restriction endonuclease-like (RecB) superfamily